MHMNLYCMFNRFVCKETCVLYFYKNQSDERIIKLFFLHYYININGKDAMGSILNHSLYNININPIRTSSMITSRYPALDISQHPFMHDITKYENRDAISFSYQIHRERPSASIDRCSIRCTGKGI